MGLYDNLFCGGNISKSAVLQKATDTQNRTIATLQSENLSQALEISSLNDAITATGDQAKKQIADLSGKLSDAQNSLVECHSQLSSGQRLFSKPCPAFLQEVEGKKVILGQAVIRTAQAVLYCDYPSHPSIFFPSPFYEYALNAADCNRKREDLTPIQICVKISNVFQNSIRYITDQQQWGVLDNWIPAPIVKLTGGDDCESEAAQIASAILYYEMKFGAFENCTVATGYGHLITGQGSMGHGFVVIFSNASTDLADSYIIEATLQYAAGAKTLAEAKSDYWIDWGVIGFVRDSHPEGTYWMKPEFSWWGASTFAQAQPQKESILARVKRRVLRQKSAEEIKHEHIHKIWTSRRL